MIKTDVVIIGAGIAGSSTAFYLKRANIDFILIDAENPGGMLNKLESIENFPSYKKVTGKELVFNIMEQLKYLGVEVIKSNVQTILKNNNGFEVVTDNDSFLSTAVIVACGNSKQSEFIDGEEKYFGNGVSYCAVCDANFFKGNDVAVIGNNNIVLEESLYLADIVNKVNLICPETLNGDVELLKKVKNHGKIRIYENELVEEIEGDELGVTSVKTKNFSIPVYGVFPFVGKKSGTKIFSSLAPSMNKDHLLVDEKMMTNIDGLFGAGDIIEKKLRQLITSASDGAIAASAVIDYLRK